ncbi:MAG: alcohol dehydrogenase catalytic domain-containing protein [Deltaproteobacteria bacterium]|nr:alcohol dehydrogenase catalytic domain-containing protein [Deltaproteobacteria bacterium]
MDTWGLKACQGTSLSARSAKDPNKQWIGKRVVGEINFGCGDCESCARDLSRHCPNRAVMGIFNADGAFAQLSCCAGGQSSSRAGQRER